MVGDDDSEPCVCWMDVRGVRATAEPCCQRAVPASKRRFERILSACVRTECGSVRRARRVNESEERRVVRAEFVCAPRVAPLSPNI